MAGPVREETYRPSDAARRLESLGAEFLKQHEDGRQLFYLRPFQLYAMTKRTLFGGVWIGFYKDRADCGCG